MIPPDRIELQNFLINLVRDGKFFKVRYLPSGLASVSEIPIKPVDVFANEVESSFASDQRMGRREVRHRTAWSFEVLVSFPCEVELQTFETSIIDTVPRLTRTPIRVGAAFRLVRTIVQHPVTKQPSGGTQVKFLFEADADRA